MAVLKRKKTPPTVRFFKISSTSDTAKTLRAAGRETFVVAACQITGRGRNARSFSSEKGGLYLSYLCFPEKLSAKKAFGLIASAAVAVCKTLERFSLHPTIKWPNDVYVSGKKICGILTENTLTDGYVKDSVIGVGVNVNNRLDDSLAEIATTMRAELGKRVCLRKVEKLLKEQLLLSTSMDEYFAHLGYLGEVELLEGGKRYAAFAEKVDEDGGLVVVVNGQRQKKTAAEISLRMKG